MGGASLTLLVAVVFASEVCGWGVCERAACVCFQKAGMAGFNLAFFAFLLFRLITGLNSSSSEVRLLVTIGVSILSSSTVLSWSLSCRLGSSVCFIFALMCPSDAVMSTIDFYIFASCSFMISFEFTRTMFVI